jgi:hypothetical protein
VSDMRIMILFWLLLACTAIIARHSRDGMAMERAQ